MFMPEKSRLKMEKRFRHVLLIGIGGSALGPQFVADALGIFARSDGHLFLR